MLFLRTDQANVTVPFDFSEIDIDDTHYNMYGLLNAQNAAALRETFPHLNPRPLGAATSAGTGDRLGLATPGHVRAFQSFGAGVTPVFAQQSIREMDRLGRSPQTVLDDATFGCVASGWELPVGADADHIHDINGIDRCLAAGFTTFTLDPGDEVRDVRDGLTQELIKTIPWARLEDDEPSFLSRYEGTSIGLSTQRIELDRKTLLTAAAKYGAAVARTAEMYRHLMDHATYPVEVEIAIDETAYVTSIAEHYYMTSELRRLGVEWVSFAPRYEDGFEKGVEYIGSVDVLIENIAAHAQVSELFGGYKISIHSGSDKFSIYPGVVEATGGRVHLKTSGTSYLTAVDIIARHNAELFRQIYSISRDSYRQSRATYQVSADLGLTPETTDITDATMPELVHEFNVRQILHVGYGDVLGLTDEAGNKPLDAALRATVLAHYDEYSALLTDHIARHIAPFSKGAVA